jgi:large subunit ribosomal protein L9
MTTARQNTQTKTATRRSTKKSQLLLLKDVDDLGRSGDVVSVKPGFARNYLLPQKKAVIATQHTLKMQAELQEVRMQQAAVDRKDSEALAERINALQLRIEVKVDPDGNMYGSVSAGDILKLLEKEGIVIERRAIQLSHPIKTLGKRKIDLKLKEGVPASFLLEVEKEQILSIEQ